MLREFLSIFRSGDALGAMGDNFTRQLTLAAEMTKAAGDLYFSGTRDDAARQRLRREDIQVNQLERMIRKQVYTHLSTQGHGTDLAYCLFLLSLVKDVERLGDYAKNLTEVVDFRPEPLPDDERVHRLRDIRAHVDTALALTPKILSDSDRDQALAQIQRGRELQKECDRLVADIANFDYDSRTAVALVLGARYYKRIVAHLGNVLSSLVMPLHKIDYFDEDELSDAGT